MRAVFDNPKGPGGRFLIPGRFARVRVAVSDEYDAVMIPERALLTDLTLKYVLVVKKAKNNEVERVDVELGRLLDNSLRVIRSGLKGDEWLIIEGMTRVRPGVEVNPKEGKMTKAPPVGG